MKTTVTIPDELVRRAEKMARKRKISRSRLIAEAVENYLDEYEETEITAKLNEFYEKNPAVIDPTITKMAAISLPRGEW